MTTEIAVLLYHHVGPVRAEACRGLTVTPRAFARQMSAIAALGYSTVLPAEWARHVQSGAEIPARSLMITFDDCYSDLSEHAYPELQRHSFSSITFVPSALIGGKISCTPGRELPQMEIMSANEIARWAGRGMTFGAHSRNHLDLTALDDAALATEISGSCQEVSDVTGQTVDSFAYPFGRFDDRVVHAVSSACATAFTIDEGLNDRAVPLHRLRRTMVQHNDSIVDVCLRLRFGRSALESVRSGIRRVIDPGTNE